jgi:hypothetical protein
MAYRLSNRIAGVAWNCLPVAVLKPTWIKYSESFTVFELDILLLFP